MLGHSWTRFIAQPAVSRRTLSQAAATPPSHVQRPYFVRRNTHGSLPVYTDIRNGGTRYLVQIRNVEGQAQVLANELKASLFGPNSPATAKLGVRVHGRRHIIITGGRWKVDVMAWLASRGF
ncbi:mitochondrial large subunit ribosomal protein-domain-containing protein [Pisolithus croceorrhizus]|nr:mitochondrial large subunit ribosomal protein-domain-containing protein [Pisolithus croceorrhizus]KAI6164340.1 mitochondrial large subunit ribosomal protein-domain-containing protein [Pisolithus thermaeus]